MSTNENEAIEAVRDALLYGVGVNDATLMAVRLVGELGKRGWVIVPAAARTRLPLAHLVCDRYPCECEVSGHRADFCKMLPRRAVHG